MGYKLLARFKSKNDRKKYGGNYSPVTYGSGSSRGRGSYNVARIFSSKKSAQKYASYLTDSTTKIVQNKPKIKKRRSSGFNPYRMV